MAKSTGIDLKADVERLLTRHNPREIIDAVNESAPKGRGRPAEDDSNRLRRMADLLIAEEPPSETAAAQSIACEDPGHSKDATARRLRRKFGKDRERLVEEARLRAALIEAPDPDAAANLLSEHLINAVGDLRDSADRDEAAEALKRRLTVMVDEVKDALDAVAVERSLGGLTRPFSREDIEAAFEEDVEAWDL